MSQKELIHDLYQNAEKALREYITENEILLPDEKRVAKDGRYYFQYQSSYCGEIDMELTLKIYPIGKFSQSA